MHLLNSGHQFADVSFGANLQEYATKQRQYTDLRDRYSEVYFVRAYERFGEANFDVLRINKAPKYLSVYISEGDVTHSHHKQDDLPEHIMGKLAVLQMMERNQYVEEVGTSMGDGMFYVVL